MDKLILKLYVSGMSGKSMQAIENITHFCDEHLHDAFDLEIIDIYKDPGIAEEQQIVFTPSLIKLTPLPKKIMVGNFSNTDKIKLSLGVDPKNN